MKSLTSKPWMQHLFVVVLSIVIPLFFLSPLMQGKKLAQSDHVSWEGMSKEIRDYKAETGEHSYWTNSMFSGMPSFFVSGRYPFHITKSVIRGVNRSLPQPVGVMAIMIVCFYILGLTLGVRSLFAFIGALAFGFMSYSVISLEAGHINKIAAVAFMPLILAGLVSLGRKKYIIGAALFALGLALQMGTVHFQIIYYTIFLCVVYVLYEVVGILKQKDWVHLGKSAGIVALGIALGVGANFTSIYTSQVYSKETMRGGKSALADNTPSADANTTKTVKMLGVIPITVDTTKGLDKGYAQSWSLGPMESFTFILPSFRGGGSGRSYKNTDFYKAAAKQGASPQQINGAFYFGPQRFTSGPNYMGVIIVFFFLLAFFIYQGKDKWWVLVLFLLSLFLSWGKYFDFVNDIFFYLVPMYNKFRAPSMILALPALVTAYLAVRVIYQVANEGLTEAEWKRTWQVALGLGGVMVLLGFFGLGTDFMHPRGGESDLLIEARKSLLAQDTVRGLFFLFATLGLLFMVKKDAMKPTAFGLALLALVAADYWTVNGRYFNSEDFVSQAQYDRLLQPSQALAQIKQDSDPHFRVLNMATNTFNDAVTSYHVNSVGGYHAAKLIRYQDIMERRLYGEMQSLSSFINQGVNNQQLQNYMANLPTLNMLNTKYVVFSNQQFVPNSAAAGNAWFVDKANVAQTAEEELNFPKNIAKAVTLPEKHADVANQLAATGSAKGSISLTEYAPNRLVYQANNTSNSPQLAVFSEVYYKGSGNDWIARVDGEETPIYRTNYILRSVLVPPGEHKIEMHFNPKTVAKGTPITAASSILLILLLAGALFLTFKKPKEDDTKETVA